MAKLNKKQTACKYYVLIANEGGTYTQLFGSWCKDDVKQELEDSLSEYKRKDLKIHCIGATDKDLYELLAELNNKT